MASALIVVFGWVLVGTTIGPFAAAWRMHYRFAWRSVPLATRTMPLFAAGPFVVGVFLLPSLLAGRGAV